MMDYFTLSLKILGWFPDTPTKLFNTPLSGFTVKDQSLVMCRIFLPPTTKGHPTVIPWWSWGQHDYSCRRVQLLVHGLCPVKHGLDQGSGLVSKGLYKEWDWFWTGFKTFHGFL